MNSLSNKKIEIDILEKIHNLLEDKSTIISLESPLIGDQSVFDSMRLVELCLILEDMASDIGFEFDWTSEVAMSRSKSMFRNAGSLISEFISQMEKNT